MVEVPALALGALAPVAEIRAAISGLSTEDWIVLTSETAVRFLQAAGAKHEQGDQGRQVAPDWKDFKIAAIGDATARAAELVGAKVHFVSSIARGEVFGEELADRVAEETAASGPRKVLILRAKRGAPGLVDAFARRGVSYTEVGIYDTVLPALTKSERDRLSQFISGEAKKAILLTSGECARNLQRLIADVIVGDAERSLMIPAIAIGPETAEAARSIGFSVVATGANPRLLGLVEELERYVRRSQLMQ